MIAGAPALPISFGPAMNVAGRITTVATNPQHGIFRKHSRDKVSPANIAWENTMPFTNDISARRSRTARGWMLRRSAQAQRQ